MNKLKIYVVRDRLAGDSSLILTAKNDEVLKRNVKGVLLSQNQNFLNTDTVDKDIYIAGELDTDTGAIVAEAIPNFIINVETLRLELVAEIRSKKEQAGIEEESDDVGSVEG